MRCESEKGGGGLGNGKNSREQTSGSAVSTTKMSLDY